MMIKSRSMFKCIKSSSSWAALSITPTRAQESISAVNRRIHRPDLLLIISSIAIAPWVSRRMENMRCEFDVW